MVGEGDVAPEFELPGVRDGEITQVALDEYLGQEVVILAFYPGDFNPVCDGASTGLDDLDLFTMQKDVGVLAISGDSVFSHQAFADQYNLDVPLLADIDGKIAAAYGVEAESDRYNTRRAVFVVDHSGNIEYRWVGDGTDEMPDSDEIHRVIENVGDDETAQSRYRVGHAHYIEGRRAFTSAMKAFEEREWMLASQDFAQAGDGFDEAKEEFNSAVRFGSNAEEVRYYKRAEKKAEALWRAADWMSDSAGSFASGQGLRAEELKSDAEGPLETAREIHEPVEPEDFPPDSDPAGEDGAVLGGAASDTTIELDDTPVDETPEASSTEDETEATPAAGATGNGETTAAGDEQSGEEDEPEDDIDDEELEAITAELEEQNEAVDEEADDEVTDGDVDDTTTDAGDTEESKENIELDLTDPNEDEDEDDEDETTVSEDVESSGDHGVPDSL